MSDFDARALIRQKIVHSSQFLTNITSNNHMHTCGTHKTRYTKMQFLCLLCAHHLVPVVRTYLRVRTILKYKVRAFQRFLPIQILSKTRSCSSNQSFATCAQYKLSEHDAYWGGAAQLRAGKNLCSSNLSKFTQKKISDRVHPHHRENDTSKSAILGFFKLKIEFT